VRIGIFQNDLDDALSGWVKENQKVPPGTRPDGGSPMSERCVSQGVSPHQGTKGTNSITVGGRESGAIAGHN